MRIAILGATSLIAKDLIISFSAVIDYEIILFARRPQQVKIWLAASGLSGRYTVADYTQFGMNEEFEAILNFVGVGDPARAIEMGISIFNVTAQYDQMALDYLKRYPECRYLFMSSGAAYGSSFSKPVDENTQATISLNDLKPQDWYGVAKLYAECRHRANAQLAIVDIRVFNYFSHSQDINARFLITDILRATRDKSVLKTSPDNIVRDFLNPVDFYRLVHAILSSPATNAAIDCYSKAPIEKFSLLEAMQEKYGLQYEIFDEKFVNATGQKMHYYSMNTQAANFGFEPSLTSLQGVLNESDVIFEGHH